MTDLLANLLISIFVLDVVFGICMGRFALILHESTQVDEHARSTVK